MTSVRGPGWSCELEPFPDSVSSRSPRMRAGVGAPWLAVLGGPPPTPSFSPGDVASTEPRGPSPTAHPGSVTCFPHVRSGHCITGAGQAESAPRLCPFPAGPWAEPSGPLRQRRVERIRSVNAATVIRTGAMGGRQHSHSGPAGASHGLLSFCHCVTWDSWGRGWGRHRTRILEAAGLLRPDRLPSSIDPNDDGQSHRVKMAPEPGSPFPSLGLSFPACRLGRLTRTV